MSRNVTPTNHLDHAVGRDPETGKGRCVCGWSGSFYMADSHLADVKARWETHNRRVNAARDRKAVRA